MSNHRTAPLPPVTIHEASAPSPAPVFAPTPATPNDHPTVRKPRGTQRLVDEEQPLSHRHTEQDPRSAKERSSGAGMTPLTGKVLAGRYELGKRLGVGGMGEVYRAHHLALGVEVAVKVMHPYVAVVDEYARRFRREAHAASLLHHRNVVRVIDFGEDQGHLYIAMELLRGENVAQWLHRAIGAPPPVAEVLDVFSQVLDAFEAAHAAGIVHRDLKPENVFLAIEADGKRIVKVVDFGLAHVDDYRDTGPTLTKQDIVSGTPEYMSPEQCRSLAVGPSTDIYAIGCLLTEMLQLIPPFVGGAVEVMTQQMFVPPPPLRRPITAEPVPPLLERLRISLLAKHPEQRPKDVAEIRRLLGEAMRPDAEEQRFPGRKPDIAVGRGDFHAPMLSGPPGPPSNAPSAGVSVSLVRLAEREDGLSQSATTGLSAQGIVWMDSHSRAGAESGGAESASVESATPYQVVVLDAGADVAAAASWLRAKALSVPVVVCLADVSTERMNTLIAAGAKDIVPYPVTSDVLARKIRRAARARNA
ncbi:MAG: serine/threonine-protein kinase [Polyangiaceae bacterium]